MQKLTLSFLFLFSLITVQAQIVKVAPESPSVDDEIEILFDASKGTAGLLNATSVYMHSGVVLTGPVGTSWEYVIGNWGKDDGIGKMTKVIGEQNLWSIKIPKVREYYGVPVSSTVFRLSMVFRNADGSKEGKGTAGNFNGGTVSSNGDIFIDLDVSNYVQITAPLNTTVYFTEKQAQTFAAKASSVASKLSLYLDFGKGFELLKSVENQQEIKAEYIPSQTGKVEILAEAIFESDTQKITKNYQFVIRRTISTKELPAGIRKGINYLEDASKAILVLEAPGKEFAHVVGDFNNWEIKDEFLMNQTPDGEMFWLELSDLTPGKEYVFQYWLGEDIKVGDPYADKVADPWNDEYIEPSVYPNLPTYDRRDFGVATVLQTGQKAFEWRDSESSWSKPAKENLIIYELLVRDFIGSHNYKDLSDTLSYLKKLGVNAIELMPIMEFEGNESWGYNPSYFFAPDKYYGSKNALKNFIQTAHEQGFAVILDMVLNHAYGQNPMVKMYWDKTKNKPAINSPWFNQDATHPFSVGYDFNHESPYTQSFVDDVNMYWLKEFHFDGYRFDLSKGFTQTQNSNNVDKWGQKDDTRIAILKRMASKIWEKDKDAYVILEHFAAAAEEDELQQAGMLTWGNHTHSYGDLLTGNTSSNISGADDHGMVSYMESHDEERLMYKADNSLVKTTTYAIHDELVALNRIKMLAAFFYPLPGPKMMWQFQELGYDVGIDFNGRVGVKPQVWGENGLAYYKQEERQKLLEAHAAIIGLVQNHRATFSDGKLTKTLSGSIKQLSFEADEMDAVIIGNFDIEEQSKEVTFPASGTWFSYFSTDSLVLSGNKTTVKLSPGEFQIYTTKKMEARKDLVTVFDPIVFTEADIFSGSMDVTLYLKANLAQSLGAKDFKDLADIYLVGGVVTDGPNGVKLKYKVDNISSKNQLSLGSAEQNIWQIAMNPRSFFGVPENEEIFRIGLYFSSKDTLTKGLGYGNEIIWLNLKSEGDVVKVNPEAFYKDTPITITLDAALAGTNGTAGLTGASEIYMHAGIITNAAASQDWGYTVGNWGKDDGIGKMKKVAGSDSKWEITITPNKYFAAVPTSATWYRIGMVFRNGAGTLEGKNRENADIFINFAEMEKELILAAEPIIQKILIYPNPTNGVLKIESKESIYGVSLYTLSGNLVKKFSNTSDLRIDGLAAGSYLLEVYSKSGKTTKRIFLR